jgi:hypothetical protein
MTRRGEKDGLEFDAPFPPGPVPPTLYTTTGQGDSTLADYKYTVEPPGLRDELSVLAYIYCGRPPTTKRDIATGEKYIEYRYNRSPHRDKTLPK